MRRNLIYVVLLVMLAVALAACGGGGSTIVNPPDNFDKLTARLLGGDGNPLAGVSVRVEGTNTGVTTDANGNFTLLSTDFPNGVDSSNELSFGRSGVILGTTELVPVANPSPEIKFAAADNGGGGTSGTGSISGHVYENSADANGNILPLENVEVTLFSIELGGIYQTHTDADGAYGFSDVAAGHWEMTAYLDGYNPEMAMIVLNEDVDLTYDFGLTPDGSVPAGEGIYISGTLTDSKSGDPIAGALVSCMADTGYMGIAEPGVYDDVMAMESGAPSSGVDSRGGSMMPWRYDPQYQETTTDAAGHFEFTNPVVGYSIWLNYSADGYLSGSHYESIDGRTDDLALSLTLDPIVPTDISGTVVDENGDPVEGAYVEFIFSWGGGGILPMDVDVPVGMPLEDFASDGSAMRNDVGSPVPPMAPGEANTDAGWESAPQAGGGSTDSGTGADNMLMQRFRFEHQGDRSGSDVMPFDGYYSATTGPDGTFAFTDVPAGEYSVFVSAYRHLPYNEMFTADEDPANNELTVTLPNIPVGAVEGTVTDENGAVIPDALITCTQPYVDPFTYTDENGHFLIENVPTGEWIISGYKQGFLTAGVDTSILEDQTITVNFTLNTYEPPARDTIDVYGHVYNGEDNTGVAGASMVFTPTDPELGSYYRHVYSNDAGEYATDLIPGDFQSWVEPDVRPGGEYNLLLQSDGFEDLYIRIYVDPGMPEMDYWLWKIGAGGRGGWVVPGPMPGGDPNGGGGSTDSGGGTTDGGNPTDPTPMPPDPMPM